MRMEIQEERRQKFEEAERKILQQFEKLTYAVCFYGLWQREEQINESLQRLNTENEKRGALISCDL